MLGDYPVHPMPQVEEFRQIVVHAELAVLPDIQRDAERLPKPMIHAEAEI